MRFAGFFGRMWFSGGGSGGGRCGAKTRANCGRSRFCIDGGHCSLQIGIIIVTGICIGVCAGEYRLGEECGYFRTGSNRRWGASGRR